MTTQEREKIMKLLSFYKNEDRQIGNHMSSGWGITLSMGIQSICGGDKERVPSILRQLVEEGYLRENCGDYFFK